MVPGSLPSQLETYNSCYQLRTDLAITDSEWLNNFPSSAGGRSRLPLGTYRSQLEVLATDQSYYHTSMTVHQYFWENHSKK